MLVNSNLVDTLQYPFKLLGDVCALFNQFAEENCIILDTPEMTSALSRALKALPECKSYCIHYELD